MSSDRTDENTGLPPWLRDVPLPPRPRGAGQPAAPQPAEPSPPAAPSTPGLPDWLSAAGAEAAPETSTPFSGWSSDPPASAPAAQHSSQSDLPDWLRDTQPPQPQSAEQLPDWLKDLAGSDAPAKAPTSTAGAEVNMPDWLRQPQGSDTPGTDEQPPDWQTETAEPDTTADTPAGSGATPSWLNDLATEFSVEKASALPDWLQGGLEPAAPEPANAADVPDWLHDTQPPQRAEPPTPAGASNGTNVIASWLSDTSAGTDEEEITAEPFSFGEASDTPAPAPSAGPPSWLSGANDDADSGPDWLKDSSPAADRASTPSDAPLWLQDLEREAQSQPQAPSSAAPSWLQDATSTPPPPPAADVPAWLQDAGAEPAAAPSSDMPSWLQDATSTPPPPPAADVPAWLQDAGAEPAAAPPADMPSWLQDATSTPPPPPAADVPAWLQDAGTEPAAAPSSDMPSWLQDATSTPPPPPPADVPAWLQDAGAEPAAAPSSDMPSWLQDATSAPPPPAEALPDWLRSAADTTPPASTPGAQQADTLPGLTRADSAATPPPDLGRSSDRRTTSAHDDLPAWLRPRTPAAPEPAAGQDVPPWLREEAGEPLPNADFAGDSSLPAWLRGAPLDLPPAASVPPPAPTAPPNLDWLEEATIAESQRSSAAESSFFGGTELPEWLRPPEPEAPKRIDPADARSLDWLTKLGGPEEPEVATTATPTAPKLSPRVSVPRTAAQIEALALLERLAADPFPTPAPLPTAAQPNVLQRLGIERTLYFALLIALLVGMLLPLPASLGLSTPPSAPGATALFQKIDSLSENDVVLLGYEWDARRSGELRPLEQAVLGHLIQRKVKLVLVSTDPQGSLLLYDFRDQLQAAGYRRGGEDYILLGYKAGGELALRSFAQDFRAALRSDFQGDNATISALAAGSNPDQPRLAQLGDFAAIIVLADEPQDVQGWMEQVHPFAPQVPMAYLLPAEAAPLVQPYLSQPGIYHLAGKQGALAYQAQRGLNGMPAAQIAFESSQQRLSLLLYIALFLVGALMLGGSAAVVRGRKRS